MTAKKQPDKTEQETLIQRAKTILSEHSLDPDHPWALAEGLRKLVNQPLPHGSKPLTEKEQQEVHQLSQDLYDSI